jgi:hypothetical protein
MRRYVLLKSSALAVAHPWGRDGRELGRVMKALGLPAGDLRKPLTALDGAALAKGVRIVQEMELDKRYGYKVSPISAVAA